MTKNRQAAIVARVQAILASRWKKDGRAKGSVRDRSKWLVGALERVLRDCGAELQTRHEIPWWDAPGGRPKDVEYAGFVTWEDGRFLIVVATKWGRAVARFSIAHELGHVALGHVRATESAAFRDRPLPGHEQSHRPAREQEANFFAANILAPPQLVAGAFRIRGARGSDSDQCLEPCRDVAGSDRQVAGGPEAMGWTTL
jgi:hypothetical protein